MGISEEESEIYKALSDCYDKAYAVGKWQGMAQMGAFCGILTIIYWLWF